MMMIVNLIRNELVLKYNSILWFCLNHDNITPIRMMVRCNFIAHCYCNGDSSSGVKYEWGRILHSNQCMCRRMTSNWWIWISFFSFNMLLCMRHNANVEGRQEWFNVIITKMIYYLRQFFRGKCVQMIMNAYENISTMFDVHCKQS